VELAAVREREAHSGAVRCHRDDLRVLANLDAAVANGAREGGVNRLADLGLFAPLQSLPPALQAVARALPLTYAVSLLEGIRKGEAWSAHLWDLAALLIFFAACTALSSKVFRWE